METSTVIVYLKSGEALKLTLTQEQTTNLENGFKSFVVQEKDCPVGDMFEDTLGWTILDYSSIAAIRIDKY